MLRAGKPSAREDARGGGEGTDQAIAVEAPPGLFLVFDGHLWHGTWPRSTPGDTPGVHCLFMGPYGLVGG